jgi:hypothetical protein
MIQSKIPLWICIFIFIYTFFSLEIQAQVQNPISSTDSQRTISYVMPDGKMRTLLALADADDDGITNEMELDGFYYCRREGVMHLATQSCDGVLPDVTYKTDPDRWSTDGDPYSDFTEVSGVNMHPAVTIPENHPLVASGPIIVVSMPSYSVTPNGEITDTEGTSQSQSYTNEATIGIEVGYSETATGTVGTSGIEASASATLSVSASASYTASSTSESEMNWSKSRSVNPSEAAYLSLNLFMENQGSTPILDLEIQFNIVVGEKVIATITPNIIVNSLAPGQRFPEETAPYIVVERDIGNNQIAVTLEELKSIQLGAPVKIVVTQIDGKVGRWNSDTQSFASDVVWSEWEANIEPVIVNLHADLGDGEAYIYKIYAGTAVYDPGLTFRDIVSVVFDVVNDNGVDKIEGRPYPGEWFLTSPSQAVSDEWNAQGRPQSLMDVPMHRETIISMKSPGSEPGPKINLATFTPDFRYVLVSASAQSFPIISVSAEVMVGGELIDVDLVKDGAFYKNETPFSEPAEVNGTAIVEDARSDVASKKTVIPAFYTSAQDIIDYSSFLPIPSGDEYLLFVNGDTSQPAVIYCDFDYKAESTEIEGREYLTLETNDSTNFSEHPERFLFEKIRINMSNLQIDPYDISFSNASGGGHGFGYSTLSCSEHSGNIDLYGTSFKLDPFTKFEGNRLFVDKRRKKIDWYGGSPQKCITGGIPGAIKLAYDNYTKPVRDESLFNGQAAFFVVDSSNGPQGYVNAGAQTSLEVDNAMTIEAWIKPNNGGMILNKEGEYELWHTTDGTIHWAIANSSPGWFSIPIYYRPKKDEWVHVAVTYDGAHIKTFINGDLFHVLAGNGSIGDHPSHSNQDEFRIGSRQASSSNYDGSIDEVRIWNVARTEEEIQETVGTILGPEIYESPSSGLIGYWRLDEFENLGVGNDSTFDVRDYSLNQNHGDIVGTVTLSDITITSVSEKGVAVIPEQFMLHQNYPNPFNPTTHIKFDLSKSAHVELSIYNVLGQRVRTLVQGPQIAGVHSVEWDGLNQNRLPVSSGIYIYHLRVGQGFVSAKKMLLTK